MYLDGLKMEMNLKVITGHSNNRPTTRVSFVGNWTKGEMMAFCLVVGAFHSGPGFIAGYNQRKFLEIVPSDFADVIRKHHAAPWGVPREI